MKVQPRGMLICTYNDMRGSYVTRRLVEEASALGLSLVVMGVADTVLTPDGALYNGGNEVGPADFGLLRVKSGYLKDALAQNCRWTFNEASSFARFVDKYEQLQVLEGTGMPRPDYLLATAGTPFSDLAARLGDPFVAKGLCSSQGREVFLVRSERELRDVAMRFGDDRELLFESYVATSHGRDVRLFVIRGEVVCGMQRMSNGGFQANFARGATVAPLAVTDEMRRHATAVYQRTGLDYFGLDLLYGESGLVFCETNVMPGFEGMEGATGVNVARLILAMVREVVLEGGGAR